MTDPETGEVHTIGAQGREVATAEVCAPGDYVPTPLRATVRAAGCYNRGQQDAFDLRFQYSGGMVHTGYFMEEDRDAAMRRSRKPYSFHAVYIQDG